MVSETSETASAGLQLSIEGVFVTLTNLTLQLSDTGQSYQNSRLVKYHHHVSDILTITTVVTRNTFKLYIHYSGLWSGSRTNYFSVAGCGVDLLLDVLQVQEQTDNLTEIRLCVVAEEAQYKPLDLRTGAFKKTKDGKRGQKVKKEINEQHLYMKRLY